MNPAVFSNCDVKESVSVGVYNDCHYSGRGGVDMPDEQNKSSEAATIEIPEAEKIDKLGRARASCFLTYIDVLLTPRKHS